MTDRMSFYREQERELLILLPHKVLVGDVEVLLKQCYRRSFFKKFESVIFDWSAVKWIDLFSASLIAIWILELGATQKKLSTIFPRAPHVTTFLIQYGFQRILKNSNINILGAESSRAKTVPSTLQRACLFPFTFLHEADFIHLMEDLRHERRLETVLTEVSKVEIVKNGKIRDVVLEELGDNMYLHGGGQLAHIAMTKLSSDLLTQKSSGSHLAPAIQMLESSFLNQLSGRPFIEIVISDKGPGIFNTLLAAYKSDSILDNKSDAPSECDLLEYAFLYHTSRRTQKERVGELIERISNSDSPVSTPTGLFRLKEEVRNHHGLLYVRSGSSIICYNFYDNPLNDRPMRSIDIPALKSLCNFGGTQYRILFPTMLPVDKTSRRYFDISAMEHSYSVDYVEYVALAEYFTAEISESVKNEALGLDNLFRYLDRIRATHQGKRVLVLIDFNIPVDISAKAQHILILELLARQTLQHTYICLRVDSGGITRLHSEGLQRSVVAMPMQAYDAAYSPTIIGGTASDAEILSTIYASRSRITPELTEYAQKYKHLFRYNQQSDQYTLTFPPMRVIRFVQSCLAKRLSDIVFDPNTQIFDPNTMVLLLSQAYCKGYFEIQKLFADPHWRSFLMEWLHASCIIAEPDVIVSVGRSSGDVIDSLLSKYPQIQENNVKHVNVHTRQRGQVDLMGLFDVRDAPKVLVFADVIGTTSTIMSVVQALFRSQHVAILTIVDAKDSEDAFLEVKGHQIPIMAAIKKSLTYPRHLPFDWHYSQVSQVDPVTHLLVTNKAKEKGAIWKPARPALTSRTSPEDVGIENTFLTDIVAPLNAISEGHYMAGDKHLSFLFDSPEIVKGYADEITRIICEDVETYRGVNPDARELDVSHVFYPAFNPGLSQLADKVAAQFHRCTVISISSEEFRSLFDQERPMQEVSETIILDDATESGDTLYRMVDIVERRGARQIYGYVIIQRGTEYDARRLERFRHYGNAQVHLRYMADCAIPSFKKGRCPLCLHREGLDSLRERVAGSPMEQHISNMTDTLKVINVNTKECHGETTAACAAHPNLATAAAHIRWLLELAKTEPGARHHLGRILNQCEHDPVSSITLIRLLGRERVLSSLDADTRGAILYPAFVSHLLQACEHHLEMIGTLTVEELSALLVVAEETAVFLHGPDEVISNLVLDRPLDILKKVVDSPAQLVAVLAHIFLSQACRQHPGILLSALHKVQSFMSNSESIAILAEAYAYWEKLNSDMIDMRASRLASFNTLRGGIFHDIDHQVSDLRTLAKSSNDSLDVFANSWAVFRSDIVNILMQVRRTVAYHVTPDLCSKFTELVHKCFNCLEKGDSLIADSRSDNDASNSNSARLPTLLINSLLDSIVDILFHQDGIRGLLVQLETKVTSVAKTVIEQHTTSLTENSIKVRRKIPEDLCVVFGEKDQISKIFHNLIKNAWASSGGSLLEIGVLIDHENDMLSIYFADDGKADPYPPVYSKGLSNVDTIAKECYGHFEFWSAEQIEKTIGGSFFTAAVVTLPWLKPPD